MQDPQDPQDPQEPKEPSERPLEQPAVQPLPEQSAQLAQPQHTMPPVMPPSGPSAPSPQDIVMGFPRNLRAAPEELRSVPGRMGDPRWAVPLGIAASNGFALLMMSVTYWVNQRSGDLSGIFVMSDFVLIPLVMGGICAYIWRGAKLSVPAYIGFGLLNSVLALLLAAVFLREGMICLLMASPLLIAFAGIGVLLGNQIFKANHRRLNASLIPIALALFVTDSLMPHHFENHEADTLIIHATPDRVWQYIVDYPANNTPSDYWLSNLGLPAPVQSTSTGHNVGATRRCLFTGGIAFDEKITVVEPGRKLEFDVVTQPNHPEVVGHLVLQKGQFLLTDNHDGTTTVTGTSWYQLNVYPVSYYDLWTQDVVRHVHLRVMRHIKMLAESPSAPPK